MYYLHTHTHTHARVQTRRSTRGNVDSTRSSRVSYFSRYGEAISHPRLSQLLPLVCCASLPPSLFGYTPIYVNVAVMEGSVCISHVYDRARFRRLSQSNSRDTAWQEGGSVLISVAAFCCLPRFISRKFYTVCRLGI